MPDDLPQSNALEEVHGDSLGELFSRDPEGYSEQDLDRIIGELRAQRARWQEAESTGAKKPRAPKALPGPVQTKSAEDLGL